MTMAAQTSVKIHTQTAIFFMRCTLSIVYGTATTGRGPAFIPPFRRRPPRARSAASAASQKVDRHPHGRVGAVVARLVGVELRTQALQAEGEIPPQDEGQHGAVGGDVV